jgi:hypothetical protein
VKNLNESEAIPKYMFLVSYGGEKDAFFMSSYFYVEIKRNKRSRLFPKTFSNKGNGDYNL